MAKPLKKRDPNRHADRFYEYLIAHKKQVLRYITVALVTALIQFVLKRLLGGTINFGEMIPFGVRFVLMFLALKYWVYEEGGTGGFYTARQVMLAVMIITVGIFIFNYLTILLVGWLGHTILINYIMQALAEIFYFAVYQFLIFKEPEND
ncbi:MAG: hypothetical protein IJ043_10805 [Clostridia bacterium]|nr:hypothetical protein [Clostridia bacterium]